MASADITRKVWANRVAITNYPTPFLLTDLSSVIVAAKNLTKLLPHIAIYYAIKSNDQPRVLTALRGYVDGFDIASLGELNAALSLGVDPSQIIFSNPVKMPAHIQASYQKGVWQFAADSHDEISKLQRYAPGCSVHVRIQVPATGSHFPLSSKFGLPIDQLETYAVRARQAGLQVNGVTFHVGSQSQSPTVWREAIRASGDCIRRLRAAGFAIDLLDIGGGFPAAYGGTSDRLHAICAAVTKACHDYIPADVRVIAEPGRCLVADSSVIVTSVIAREQRGGKNWLHIDMGAFQGMIEPLELPGWRYPVLNTEPDRLSRDEPFVLSGPTCDPADGLGEGYLLPADTRLGDRICIMSAGAYTIVYGSQFNGFAVPESHFLD